MIKKLPYREIQVKFGKLYDCTPQWQLPLFSVSSWRFFTRRKFEAGKIVGRDVLERIVDCGRWAPSGANVQCWDFIVVDDPTMRDAVTTVFLRQAQRLVDHAKGFPAVKKTYLENTVAIILVIGDPRWKVCFPQPTTPECEAEYLDNNQAIFLCSLGRPSRMSSSA